MMDAVQIRRQLDPTIGLSHPKPESTPAPFEVVLEEPEHRQRFSAFDCVEVAEHRKAMEKSRGRLNDRRARLEAESMRIMQELAIVDAQLFALNDACQRFDAVVE